MEMFDYNLPEDYWNTPWYVSNFELTALVIKSSVNLLLPDVFPGTAMGICFGLNIKQPQQKAWESYWEIIDIWLLMGVHSDGQQEAGGQFPSPNYS